MRKLGTNLVNWARIVITEKGSNLAKNEEDRPNLRYFGIPSAIRVANAAFAKKNGLKQKVLTCENLL